MGIMVYSLSWVMQDFVHQQYHYPMFCLCAYLVLLEPNEEILRQPQDPDWANAFGQTPLVVASDLGHLDVVSLLLEAKADPDLLGS